MNQKNRDNFRRLFFLTIGIITEPVIFSVKNETEKVPMKSKCPGSWLKNDQFRRVPGKRSRGWGRNLTSYEHFNSFGRPKVDNKYNTGAHVLSHGEY